MDGVEGTQNTLRKRLISILNWRNRLKSKLKLRGLHSLSETKGRTSSSILASILASSKQVVRYIIMSHILLSINYKLQDMLLRKYKFDNSEWVGIPDWYHYWKKSYFDETVYLKFEDFEAPAPASYDLVLREAYGDYMQRPPEDQQHPTHGYIAYKP